MVKKIYEIIAGIVVDYYNTFIIIELIQYMYTCVNFKEESYCYIFFHIKIQLVIGWILVF